MIDNVNSTKRHVLSTEQAAEEPSPQNRKGACRDHRPDPGARRTADAPRPAPPRPRGRPEQRARRRVPRRPAVAVRPRPGRAGPRGQGETRRQGLRARPSLPARRGHPVRRCHGRLLQAGPGRRRAPRGGVHRVLRCALHGGVRGHPHRRRPEGRAPRSRGRLLDGRHGHRRAGRRVLGRADRGRHSRAGRAGVVHELVRRHQGVHGQARRHDLHLVQRRAGPGVGLRAGRAGAVPPGPAPRAQHRRPRPRDEPRGLRAVQPAQAQRGPHHRAVEVREDDPVARPLLGARPFLAGVGRGRAGPHPGCQRPRPPRVQERGRGRGRLRRVN